MTRGIAVARLRRVPQQDRSRDRPRRSVPEDASVIARLGEARA